MNLKDMNITPEEIIPHGGLEVIRTGKVGRPPRKDRSTIIPKQKYTGEQLKGLTLEELAILYPNAPKHLLRGFQTRGEKKMPPAGALSAVCVKAKNRQYMRGAVKQMDKRISKHLNTQRFIEYFNDHIGVELIGETLVNVLLNEDEKSETKLKAVSEINKYAMIPSQAQEIKHEIDDSFGVDEREELRMLLGNARKDTEVVLPYEEEVEGEYNA